jgi:hypothetical protein
LRVSHNSHYNLTLLSAFNQKLNYIILEKIYALE